jgi:hypothetical protein
MRDRFLRVPKYESFHSLVLESLIDSFQFQLNGCSAAQVYLCAHIPYDEVSPFVNCCALILDFRFSLQHAQWQVQVS